MKFFRYFLLFLGLSQIVLVDAQYRFSGSRPSQPTGQGSFSGRPGNPTIRPSYFGSGDLTKSQGRESLGSSIGQKGHLKPQAGSVPGGVSQGSDQVSKFKSTFAAIDTANNYVNSKPAVAAEKLIQDLDFANNDKIITFVRAWGSPGSAEKLEDATIVRFLSSMKPVVAQAFADALLTRFNNTLDKVVYDNVLKSFYSNYNLLTQSAALMAIVLKDQLSKNGKNALINQNTRDLFILANNNETQKKLFDLFIDYDLFGLYKELDDQFLPLINEDQSYLLKAFEAFNHQEASGTQLRGLLEKIEKSNLAEQIYKIIPFKQKIGVLNTKQAGKADYAVSLAALVNEYGLSQRLTDQDKKTLESLTNHVVTMKEILKYLSPETIPNLISLGAVSPSSSVIDLILQKGSKDQKLAVEKYRISSGVTRAQDRAQKCYPGYGFAGYIPVLGSIRHKQNKPTVKAIEENELPD